ncbi:hypothetical protein I6E68_12050 [Salinibacterium sp. NSLL150]|uniref:hypothetical protein n=1 Tax=unclassified Salinibacterium TaxID=2632331 RepID=UPI0018CD14E0|nr:MULTISPECIES: hypothetical protein [unclassified Salinibacterium]MBH0099866.1 hypothetical protein [Salinibacterium sp. NSLL35]MBH0102620.1 hypothetical protein [Salinibacterium sp. NSLL150]MBH0105380.1 hypothetical protein [Salinibacterium sp. NSLL16]MBH0108140.1 hypothetical protein [Salinibacterium sp. NSLL17]
MSEQDRAAKHLEVRIEKRHDHPLRHAARFAAELVGSLLMGDTSPRGPGADLVVARRTTGAEVIRTSVDSVEEADQLLRVVRRDLEQKTVEEFADEWHAAP